MLDKLPWGRGIGTLEIDRVTNQGAAWGTARWFWTSLNSTTIFSKRDKNKINVSFHINVFPFAFFYFLFSFFSFLFSFFIFVVPRFRILVDFPPFRLSTVTRFRVVLLVEQLKMRNFSPCLVWFLKSWHTWREENTAFGTSDFLPSKPRRIERSGRTL